MIEIIAGRDEFLTKAQIAEHATIAFLDAIEDEMTGLNWTPTYEGVYSGVYGKTRMILRMHETACNCMDCDQ